MTVKLIKEKCINCEVCIPACELEALDLDNDTIIIDPNKCNDCGDCIEVCPTDALVLEDDKKPLGVTSSKKTGKEEQQVCSGSFSEVWVVIEENQGQIADVSWELLGLGRKLANDLGVALGAVFLGYSIKSKVNLIYEYGADKVYLTNARVLKDYRTEPYSRVLSKLVLKYKPEIILIGATDQGRDLAGNVAAQVETGLTADCTELSIEKESGLLLQTRPAFGGNIMATIICKEHRPQMATVRPKVMPVPERIPGKKGTLIEEKPGIREKDVLTKILEILPEEEKKVYLDQADIIVAGGRGLGAKENFKYIFELAEALGGTPGASRAAVEAGWIEAAYQIGQTGATVRPKLYFAVGISGAVQHLVGMKAADIIIAINSDPEAPIFEICDYGIVGDFQKILPLLAEELCQQKDS